MRISDENWRETQDLASEDNLAERVARERKAREWSQETFATQVEKILGGGFPQSAVSKIEKTSGRRAITVTEALAISKVLDRPLMELLLPVGADDNLRRLLARHREAMRAHVETSERLSEARRDILLAAKGDPELLLKVAALARNTEDVDGVRTFLESFGFGVDVTDDETGRTVTVSLPPEDDDDA